MAPWIAWLIAIASTAVCLFLWFREVRRIMRDRMSTVESAAGQLASCRKKAIGVRYDPELAEVLLRSESIYRQALELYHQSLRKPWIRLPAAVMGFRVIPQAGDEELPESDIITESEETEESLAEENTRYFGSVRFFKNMILLAVIVMIAIPTGLSVYFGRNLRQTERDLQEKTSQVTALRQENETLSESVRQEPEPSTEEPESTPWGDFQAESPYAELYPDFYAPQELRADVRETGVIYLTFDDGPSPRTGEILDILREKDAKATFFVIGSGDAANQAFLRRIVEEGHTLAMHSYSHNYGKIYASVEDYLADMYRIFTQIRDATGTTPTLFRFPGGSINGYNNDIYQDLIAEMLRRGFVPFDWNISSEDAATNGLVPANTLADNVVNGAKRVERGIVLMHDSAPKTTTVQALGPMIDRLRELGFELKALTPETMPVLYAYRD